MVEPQLLRRAWAWVQAQQGGLRAEELARALGISPALAQGLLEHLVRLGYVQKAGADLVCAVGPRAAACRLCAWRALCPLAAASPDDKA